MQNLNDLRIGVTSAIDEVIERIALDLQTIVVDGEPTPTESSGVVNAVSIDNVGYLGIMETLDLADVLIPPNRPVEFSVYVTEKGMALYEALKSQGHYETKEGEK